MRPYLYHLRTRCAAYVTNPMAVLGGFFLGPFIVIMMDWVAMDGRDLPWSVPASFYLLFAIGLLCMVSGSGGRPGMVACPALPLHPLGRAIIEALVSFALPFASAALLVLGEDHLNLNAPHRSDLLYQAMLSDLWRLAAIALPLLTGIGLLMQRRASGGRQLFAFLAYVVLLLIADYSGLLQQPASFAVVDTAWAGLVWLSGPASVAIQSRRWAVSGRRAPAMVRPGLPPLVRLSRDALLGAGTALLYGALASGIAVLIFGGIALYSHHSLPIEMWFVLPAEIAVVVVAMMPFGLPPGRVIGGGQGLSGPMARAWSMLPVPPAQVARMAYIHSLTALLLPAVILGLVTGPRSAVGFAALAFLGAGSMVVPQYGPSLFRRIMIGNFISMAALSLCGLFSISQGHHDVGLCFLVLLVIPWAIDSLVLPYRVLKP